MSLDKEWSVGFNDRGMGRGDFAVIVKYNTLESLLEVVDDDDPDLESKMKKIIDEYDWSPPKVIVKCNSKELAEHIVHLHNKSLKE